VVGTLSVNRPAASANTPLALSNRESSRIVAGYPSDYLAVLKNFISISMTAAYTPASVGLGLSSFNVSPGKESWNLNNIIKTLRLLFPGAKVCTTAIEDTWNIPQKSEKDRQTKFSRLLELARAKVLTVRQSEESSKYYDKKSTAYYAPRNLQYRHIMKSIRTIHGCVSLKGGLSVSPRSTNEFPHQSEDTLACVEVCAGYIVIRPVAADSHCVPNRLTVQGVFHKEDKAFIEELFDYCVQLKLPRRETLKASDLTIDDLLSIQGNVKYNKKPLPGNVWFDGQTYVDINGTRNVVRPDINDLVEEYLRDENKKIEDYNNQLTGF